MAVALTAARRVAGVDAVVGEAAALTAIRLEQRIKHVLIPVRAPGAGLAVGLAGAVHVLMAVVPWVTIRDGGRADGAGGGVLHAAALTPKLAGRPAPMVGMSRPEHHDQNNP